MKKDANNDINIIQILDIFRISRENPWFFNYEPTTSNYNKIYSIRFYEKGVINFLSDGVSVSEEAPFVLLNKRNNEFKTRGLVLPTSLITINFITDKELVLPPIKTNFGYMLKPFNPDEIHSYFEKALELHLQNPHKNMTQIRGLTLFILGSFMRQLVPPSAEMPPFIADAIKYIEMYREPIINTNVHEIADKLHVNYEYFIRQFKKYTGISPKQYILNIKMEHIGTLVANTDFSFPYISKIMGFSNENYFYERFKEYYGITPSEYRKKFANQM